MGNYSPSSGGDVAIATILSKNPFLPRPSSLKKLPREYIFFHPFLSWKDNKNLKKGSNPKSFG
jgi:hypothetical protein